MRFAIGLVKFTPNSDHDVLGINEGSTHRRQAILEGAGILFLTFEVGPDAEHPEIQNDCMLYEGLRFRADCRLAGKPYGHPFGVDVAFGDPILGEPEVVVADDVLGFAGVAPPTLRLYPIEFH